LKQYEDTLFGTDRKGSFSLGLKMEEAFLGERERELPLTYSMLSRDDERKTFDFVLR
jgi:hypothetical protein